jgi:polyisoprenoid-binding protein YceI
VEKVDDHTVRVTGDLTLLGVTRPLSVEVAVKRESEGGRTRLAFSAQTRIDRLEFGMNTGFPLVSKDIELVISSEAYGL